MNDDKQRDDAQPADARAGTDPAGRSADRLRLWLEGEQPDPTAIDVFVEPGADTGVLSTLPMSAGSWVFVEASQALSVTETFARIVPYSGRLEPLGGEISLTPEIFIQTESYATAPYVSITVPTAFSLADDIDLQALHADVEAAKEEGRFPDYLTTPITTLVDERSWLVPILPPLSRAARLLVRSDGAVLDGPFGSAVRSDLLPSSAAATRAEDGKIARFFGAAKVIRALRPRLGPDVRVAGYGSPEPDEGRTDPIFVAEANGSQYVVDLATRAVNRVPPAVAELVQRHFAPARTREPAASEQAVFETLGLQAYAFDLADGARR